MKKINIAQRIFLCWKIGRLGMRREDLELLIDVLPDGSLVSSAWRTRCNFILARYSHLVKLIRSQGFSEALIKLTPKEIALSKSLNWQHFLDDFAVRNGQLLERPTDSPDWWAKWYELIGLSSAAIDPAIFTRAIPGYWNVPIAAGLTFERLLAALRVFFPVLSLDFDLRKGLQIISNDRNAEEGAYLLSLKKDCSPEEMATPVGCTTLIEEMLFYAYRWSLTGEHDIQRSLIICGGTTVAVPNGTGNPCLLSWRNSWGRHNLLLIDSTDADPYFHDNRSWEDRLVWKQA